MAWKFSGSPGLSGVQRGEIGEQTDAAAGDGAGEQQVLVKGAAGSGVLAIEFVFEAVEYLGSPRRGMQAASGGGDNDQWAAVVGVGSERGIENLAGLGDGGQGLALLNPWAGEGGEIVFFVPLLDVDETRKDHHKKEGGEHGDAIEVKKK